MLPPPDPRYLAGAKDPYGYTVTDTQAPVPPTSICACDTYDDADNIARALNYYEADIGPLTWSCIGG